MQAQFEAFAAEQRQAVQELRTAIENLHSRDAVHVTSQQGLAAQHTELHRSTENALQKITEVADRLSDVERKCRASPGAAKGLFNPRQCTLRSLVLATNRWSNGKPGPPSLLGNTLL